MILFQLLPMLSYRISKIYAIYLKKTLDSIFQNTKTVVTDNILFVLITGLTYKSLKNIFYTIVNKMNLSFYTYYYLVDNNPFSISNMLLKHDVVCFPLFFLSY